MCGIAGAVTTRSGLDLGPLVREIVASQRSRGPDAEAVEAYESNMARVHLGHNRLSIIDLSTTANQPMADVNDRLRIVFNGEIYNYLELRVELEAAGARFATRSDTEVVLEAFKAWGADAFDRFIGMFALAIHDLRSGEILLARDRFGVKPLYYRSDGRTIVFGSTPTTIAAWAGAAPSLHYVARGLRFKYYEDETDASQYDGICALEPSHLLRVRPGADGIELTKTRYYDLAARVHAQVDELRDMGTAALEHRLRELLESACALRMRADVPVGVSLSGGVDSSSIAGIVARDHAGVRGYSFARPDAPESEGPAVAELAAHARIEPRWIWFVKNGNDLFRRTLAAQDAPFPSVSVMAQNEVFRSARADGTIVLLGGQGGDEAFMGYRKFFLFYAQSILRGRRFAELPHFLAAVLPLAPAVLARAGTFWGERKRYGGGGMETMLCLPAFDPGDEMGMRAGQTPLERQILDVTRFSLPTLLRYEDRNSMGNSIESRLPFMDQRVVEFGIALPERAKLGNGFGKHILRRAMNGVIPESIRVNRDKRGFDVDMTHWLATGLGDAVRETIAGNRSAVADLLPTGTNIEAAFSDMALGADAQRFKEAVSLAWLALRRG